MSSVKKLSALALAAVARPLLTLLRGKRCDLTREEIRNLRFCFSQYGEDLAVLRWSALLKPPQVYVDAGCFDPSLCSNTLLLHKSGWRGVNIDLDPLKIRLFRRARPLDDSVVAALSDTVTRMRIYHYAEPTTDCLKDEYTANKLSVIGQDPLGSEIVETTTLNDVLSMCSISQDGVGYLNVDCEGHDLKVLKGCDLEFFKPRIVTIEALNDETGAATKAYLYQNGYELREIIYQTLLFVRRSAISERQENCALS